MGRVIPAREVPERPDRLGRLGQSRLAALLASRQRARGLDPGDRRRALDLGCRIAALIVEEAVERDPAVLHRIYQRALAALAPVAPVSIRVHPEDRALGGLDALARERGFQVFDDASVGRGGCTVTWEGAELDASLPALRAALLDEVRGGAA